MHLHYEKTGSRGCEMNMMAVYMIHGWMDGWVEICANGKRQVKMYGWPNLTLVSMTCF